MQKCNYINTSVELIKMRLPGYLKLQGHCPPVKAGPFSTQPTPNQPSVPRLCGLLSCNINKKARPSFFIPLEFHSYSHPRKSDQSATNITFSVFKKITKEVSWDQTINHIVFAQAICVFYQIPRAISSLPATLKIYHIFPTFSW